jgi:hypothetical protein
MGAVITPDTSLEELEKFFTQQEQLPCGVRFALVTDQGESSSPAFTLSKRMLKSSCLSFSSYFQARKFTLGVVTADDLQK